MAERESPAETVIIDYVCDACGKGAMEVPNGGSMLASWPPQWVHTCYSCGEQATLPDRYPKVIHRRIQP